MTHWRVKLLAAFLTLILAACGPSPDAPRPTPTSKAGASIHAPSHPAPTITAPDVSLPGRLLFVKDGDLWLWQETSGQQITLQGNLFQPAWSPDGRRIAYVQRGESYSDVIVSSANGTDTFALTNDGSSRPLHSYERIYDTSWAFYPAFSPDGREVAFSGQAAPPVGSPAAEYNLALFTAPSAPGAGKAQRYAGEDGHVGRMAYTPDGSAIVFAFTPNSRHAPYLARYDRERQSVNPVPDAPEQSYDPSFSADGHWLAFATRDGQRTDIFAVPTIGGSPVRLTSLGTARAPAFSPDGQLLAFLATAPQGQRFDLWVLDLSAEADGLRAGQPRQITHDLGADADSGLAWSR